jgi:hypothetical protein
MKFMPHAITSLARLGLRRSGSASKMLSSCQASVISRIIAATSGGGGGIRGWIAIVGSVEVLWCVLLSEN